MSLTALLLCVAWLDGGAARYIEEPDSFPGWKGELPLPSYTTDQQVTTAWMGSSGAGYVDDGQDVWRGTVEQVSWEPRIFVLHNFLSDAECDHLINLAKPRMTKSAVVDNDTGKSVDSEVRTSSGTFFSRMEDDVIAGIEERISMVTMLPENHGEGLQVLHYQHAQKYEPHHDYFHDPVNARPEVGGNRVATVLMYLSTVEEGGETVFPAADAKVSGPGWSDCARRGLAVKPTKGAAVLFYSLKPDGTTDPKSLHGSCPVIKGEKWSAPKWIHTGQVDFSSAHQKAKWGDCMDADDRCGEWAAIGECESNPGYMLPNCRKSCRRCAERATA